MSPGKLPESDSIRETELTLGLPGESRGEMNKKTSGKRLFSETIDLNLGPSREGSSQKDEDPFPAAKAPIVGWPPVRASRKNVMNICKYVKVAVDGALYLRKIDLETYSSYQQLLNALEDIYPFLTIRNYLNERKAMDPANANGAEYVPAYEDKDGDWMLLGDVPWKMFVESCKRLWLMKSFKLKLKKKLFVKNEREQ